VRFLADIDPYQALIINAGVAGVFIVLFLLGQVYTRPSVERERQLYDLSRARDDAEIARQRALIDTLVSVYNSEVLPTLASYEKVLPPLLERTNRLGQRIEAILERHERELDIRDRERRRSAGATATET
jgi:hypothetical protein